MRRRLSCGWTTATSCSSQARCSRFARLRLACLLLACLRQLPRELGGCEGAGWGLGKAEAALGRGLAEAEAAGCVLVLGVQHTLPQVLEAFASGCTAVAAPALAYPTPRRDSKWRLDTEEEALALYLNAWRARIGTRIREGRGATAGVVAARRWGRVSASARKQIGASGEEARRRGRL